MILCGLRYPPVANRVQGSVKERDGEEGMSMRACGGGHKEETEEKNTGEAARATMGEGLEEEEGFRQGKEASLGDLRTSRGPSASVGWIVLSPNRPASLSLASVRPLEASVASAELLAFLLGGRAGGRGGASGRGGAGVGSLWPQEGLLSRGRARESGGRGFPLRVLGGAWPLLPLPPHPHPCRRCQG